MKVSTSTEYSEAKMKSKRLVKLISYMRSLPAKANRHFNMSVYLEHSGEHDLARTGSRLGRRHLLNCGTAACALGWAATIPSFQKDGLEMRWNGTGSTFYLKGKRYEAYEAAEKFFGISSDLTWDLFSSIGNCSGASTPKQWAKKAEKQIAAR